MGIRCFVFTSALGALLVASPVSWALNPNAKPTSGVYDEQTIAANKVDFPANAALTAERFSARVREGYLHNFGGVIDGNFFSPVYSFGTNNSKALSLIWGNNLAFPPTGTPPSTISGAAAFGTGARDVTIDLNPSIEAGVPGERPVEVGLTMLSQGSSFGSVVVKAILDDDSIVSATRTINEAIGAGVTSYGFTAPAGRYIPAFQMTHPTPTSTRID